MLLGFRVLGYVAGLAGLLLFTLGRQGAPPRTGMVACGAVLLLVSCLAFAVTYVAWIAARLAPRRDPATMSGNRH